MKSQTRTNALHSIAIATAMAFLLLTSATTLKAASLPIDQVITEGVIENQADVAGFLGIAFGPDANSPLQYSSTTDFEGMAFSYTLNSSQTYLGMSIALAGTGSFDPNTNVMTLSGTGTLGAQNFTVAGSDSLTSGPTGDVNGHVDLNFYLQGAKKFDRHEDTTYFPDGTSTSTGYFTDANGQKIPKSDFTGKDIWGKTTGQWSNDESGTDGLAFLLTSTGYSPGSGGDGSFTSMILPTPEPVSLLLFGTAALGCFGTFKTHRS